MLLNNCICLYTEFQKALRYILSHLWSMREVKNDPRKTRVPYKVVYWGRERSFIPSLHSWRYLGPL